jgi:hypothetical protein
MSKPKDVSNWYHSQSLGSVTVTLANKCNAKYSYKWSMYYVSNKIKLK